MAVRLGDRLSAARRRRLVGRTEEIELFRRAISAPELPFCVLHLAGPGGAGKTTLLKEFAACCDEIHVPALYLDARNIEPSAEAFLAALRSAMGLPLLENPLIALARQSGRRVLLLDTAEMLAPLDDWLHEEFLPQLPVNTLVVFADKHPPSGAWFSDPGWQDLTRVLSIRNLSALESVDYLSRRGVPQDQHPPILGFTHGHPLALSLVADLFAQSGDYQFHPEARPDVVKSILRQLVQKVPSAAHRHALEMCALVRVTTEPLLAGTLGPNDAHELFDWLRGLSFVESNALGLFPHDLAREALRADLRWRNREWYDELHRRAREYYSAAVERASAADQQRMIFDYIYLHRESPMIRPFLEWQEGGSAQPSEFETDDLPRLVEMVRRFEGDESAELAAHWLAKQPQGALIFRDAECNPLGYLHALSLDAISAADGIVDPAVGAAMAHLRGAPLRPGETATLFRFWGARETYQHVSPIQSLLFVQVIRHYINTPRLAFTFFPCADPDFWAPLFDYADIPRLADADFVVGGKRYGVYGHDWRVAPPALWLDGIAKRGLTLRRPVAINRPSPGAAMLSRVEFAACVQDGLRGFARPELLRQNPLLGTRLVIDRAAHDASGAERAVVLQTQLRQACEYLQRNPRDAKLYRALYHTYIHPSATQEQAAELLGLPFSTYRRHLKEGAARVAEILWQLDLGGAGPFAASGTHDFMAEAPSFYGIT